MTQERLEQAKQLEASIKEVKQALTHLDYGQIILAGRNAEIIDLSEVLDDRRATNIGDVIRGQLTETLEDLEYKFFCL